MKVTRLISPYNANGRTNLAACTGASGVYFIYRDGELRYIGYSSNNLYRTITRHFQEWNGKGDRPGLTYVKQLTKYDFKLRICFCTPARAEKLEKALIRKHKPKDNKEQYPELELTAAHDKVYNEYSLTQPVPKEKWEPAPF